MTDPAPLQPGMAPVFFGWNVWALYQASVPDESILGAIWHAGISQDQLLKLWVENQIEDNAPGANVSDPLNPDASKFRGDQVQILPSAPVGLQNAAVRDSIPALAGALQVGKEGSAALLRYVRFYNRGQVTAMPWPHDQNFVLDTVYQPDPANTLTNSPPPKTAGAALDKAAKDLNHVVTVIAWGAGAIAGAIVLSKLLRRS